MLTCEEIRVGENILCESCVYSTFEAPVQLQIPQGISIYPIMQLFDLFIFTILIISHDTSVKVL